VLQRAAQLSAATPGGYAVERLMDLDLTYRADLTQYRTAEDVFRRSGINLGTSSDR
jgi:hypothetical protein